jgi:hypothetical protein
MQIEIGVQEQTTIVEKPKRGRKKTIVHPAASLLEALDFISVAQKKTGSIPQQFSLLAGNWLCVSNDILTIATPVIEQLNVCPHTTTLIEALNKCGVHLVISQVSEKSLLIKSGDFEALVPCTDPASVPIMPPDLAQGPCTDAIKAALAGCAALTSENAAYEHTAGVLLQGGSCVGTNGHTLLEIWHGVDLPPGMVIPKLSAMAVAKTKKTITGFGYSKSSATFWFADGSFIRTALFKEEYPNYKAKLEVQTTCVEISKTFFEAVHTVSGFSHDNVLTIDKGIIKVGRHDALVTYNVKTIPKKTTLNLKDVLAIEPYFKNADFTTHLGMVYFSANNARGCTGTIDDEIPF